MSMSDAADAELIEVDTSAPKRRLCLRCQTKFESAWAGERICGRCKSTTAWKMGTPPQSHPMGGR